MQRIGLKTRLVLFTLAILAFSQIFNAGLTMSSLEKMYIQGTLSRHRVAGGDMVRKIERAIRLGKPLDRFVGMDQLFANIRSHAPSVTDVLVLLPDGTVAAAMGSAPPPRPHPRGKHTSGPREKSRASTAARRGGLQVLNPRPASICSFPSRSKNNRPAGSPWSCPNNGSRTPWNMRSCPISRHWPWPHPERPSS
ncbi:hypothetical protein [Desulfoplanes sp.]